MDKDGGPGGAARPGDLLKEEDRRTLHGDHPAGGRKAAAILHLYAVGNRGTL